MISIDDFEDEQLWCGVFQGGGARGAAYGGVLEAVRAKNQWFKATAGSSAGAITAALVAACLEPDEIRRATPALLATIRPTGVLDRLADTLGWPHLVRYDSDRLETALDRLLCRAVGREPADQAITFQELYDVTSIRLYVIVTDASTGTPFPFCQETTPAVSVAAAVIASCSIPVVFAPRYAVTDTTPYGLLGGPVIRRLQDGGLWANFPAFAFSDLAFRSYFGLDPSLQGKVLGFTLLYDVTLPSRIQRFVEIPRRYRQLAEVLSAPGDALPGPQSAPTRLLTLTRRLVWPLVCLLSAAVLLLNGTDRAELVLPASLLALVGVVSFGTVSWRLSNVVLPNLPIAVAGLFAFFAWRLVSGPAGFGDLAGATILGALVPVLVIAGLLLHRVMDRASVGLEGALKTVTGQAIRPVPWVDRLPDSHLILVRTGQLTMLSFHATAAAIEQAIADARASCEVQLDRILSDEPYDVASQMTAYLSTAERSGAGAEQDLTFVTELFPDHRSTHRAG